MVQVAHQRAGPYGRYFYQRILFWEHPSVYDPHKEHTFPSLFSALL